jgi:hypothetical protein
MGAPEPEQAPHLWYESRCGGSSADESEQHFPVQAVPPSCMLRQFTYCFLKRVSYWQIIPFGPKRRTVSTCLWEVFSSRKAANVTSAIRAIRVQGLENGKTPKGLLLSAIKKEMTLMK